MDHPHAPEESLTGREKKRVKSNCPPCVFDNGQQGDTSADSFPDFQGCLSQYSSYRIKRPNLPAFKFGSTPLDSLIEFDFRPAYTPPQIYPQPEDPITVVCGIEDTVDTPVDNDLWTWDENVRTMAKQRNESENKAPGWQDKPEKPITRLLPGIALVLRAPPLSFYINLVVFVCSCLFLYKIEIDGVFDDCVETCFCLLMLRWQTLRGVEMHQ